MGSKPTGISASRGGGILGVSKYSTPLETWMKIMEERHPGHCESIGLDAPEFVDNAAVQWGSAFEDDICKMIEELSGIPVTDREKLYRLPNYPFITCHIDGSMSDEILVENKTTNIRTFYNDWGEPGTDRIPAGYQAQVQHQMMCTGAKQCVVFCLVFPKMQNEFEHDPGDIDKYKWLEILAEMGYFHQYTVDANPELQAAMLIEYVAFWDNYVIPKTPPPPHTESDVRKLFINPSGTVLANEQIERWSSELKSIGEEVKSVKARQSELKKLILDFMRKESERQGISIDDDSTEKVLLRNGQGMKLHSWNGKMFR